MIHPLENMNVCINSHGNPSESWDISAVEAEWDGEKSPWSHTTSVAKEPSNIIFTVVLNMKQTTAVTAHLLKTLKTIASWSSTLRAPTLQRQQRKAAKAASWPEKMNVQTWTSASKVAQDKSEVNVGCTMQWLYNNDTINVSIGSL